MAIRVVVVWGPPAAGKSTYVNDRKGFNDLIWDFDEVMASVSGRPLFQHNARLIPYLMDFRTAVMERLPDEDSLDTAWLIISYPSEEVRSELDGTSGYGCWMSGSSDTSRSTVPRVGPPCLQRKG